MEGIVEKEDMVELGRQWLMMKGFCRKGGYGRTRDTVIWIEGIAEKEDMVGQKRQFFGMDSIVEKEDMVEQETLLWMEGIVQ